MIKDNAEVFRITDEEFIKEYERALVIGLEISYMVEDIRPHRDDYYDLCIELGIDPNKYFIPFQIMKYLDELQRQHQGFNQVRIAS